MSKECLSVINSYSARLLPFKYRSKHKLNEDINSPFNYNLFDLIHRSVICNTEHNYHRMIF